jgi:hypothetical protein
MNGRFTALYSHKKRLSLLFALSICIQYDNNILFMLFSILDSYSWLENLRYLMTWRNVPKIQLRLPVMCMSYGRHNRSSCLPCLVSICSLLEQPSAVPRQVFAAFRPSFAPTLSVVISAVKNEVAGGARTCLLGKKLNFLNPFSKGHVTATPSWWLKSARRMKKRSERRSRPPQYTDSWLATDGAHLRPIAQWSRIECDPNKRFGQIFPSSLSACRSPIRLVHSLPNAPRRYSCRPYLRTSGGH